MKMQKLLQFALIVVAAFAALKTPAWFGSPIPASLIFLYMFFVAAGALLVMTATEESAQGLFAPMRSLVEDPSKKVLRNIVFAVAPIVAALITYFVVMPGIEPPAELRAVHPAPPASIKAYGKTFDLAATVNPYRKLQRENPKKYNEAVKAGGTVYFKHCFFCHGAKLDGKGHFAQVFNPRPLPFTGTDTIAQLQESYVFWRIVKGGKGLPKEAGPWDSTMPIWEESLSEDEVWKVILFMYDYTGNSPRVWGHDG